MSESVAIDEVDWAIAAIPDTHAFEDAERKLRVVIRTQKRPSRCGTMIGVRQCGSVVSGGIEAVDPWPQPGPRVSKNPQPGDGGRLMNDDRSASLRSLLPVAVVMAIVILAALTVLALSGCAMPYGTASVQVGIEARSHTDERSTITTHTERDSGYRQIEAGQCPF